MPIWFREILNQTISKAEGVKTSAYLKSELYRKKLRALMAFSNVHNMELQAHFAPVGLMFNKEVLSDWDKYQDETIWDRVKEAGKNIFYKVNYSKPNLGFQERKKEDKAYAEGEGQKRMIRTDIVNQPGIKTWIDEAKKELKIEENWYTNIKKWWNGDKEYDGSGWGHGARTEFYEMLGMDDKADNLIEVGILSMLQRGEADISDSKRLIKKINEDPEVLRREEIIFNQIINNTKYLKENFNFVFIHPNPKKGNGIQLGGERAKGEMWTQFQNFWDPKYKDTWKVAVNELGWLLRSISLKSTVFVKKDGTITIKYSFEDQFDLRPSSNGERSIEYDVVSMITGFLYHDAAGGNDIMKIRANWSNTYDTGQMKWHLKSSEEKGKILNDVMKKM